MIVHANAHDGIVHVHDCPEHPPHSTRGGLACLWDDHSVAFKNTHRQVAIEGVSVMLSLTLPKGIGSEFRNNLIAALTKLKTKELPTNG